MADAAVGLWPGPGCLGLPVVRAPRAAAARREGGGRGRKRRLLRVAGERENRPDGAARHGPAAPIVY
jgi:hypothetical protein